MHLSSSVSIFASPLCVLIAAPVLPLSMPPMPAPWRSLALFAVSYAALALAAPSEPGILLARDGMEHMHYSGAPLKELNESAVLETHAPTPPSYWTIDIDEAGADRHPNLMFAHVLMMSLAFFVALPAAISLRAVKSPLRVVAMLAFYAFILLGCAASALYTKLTPNMYEHQAHSKQGYFFILFALALSVIDILKLFRRAFSWFRSSPRPSFWQAVILDKSPAAVVPEAEYLYLSPVAHGNEELGDEMHPDLSPIQTHDLDPVDLHAAADDDNDDENAQWAHDRRPHMHQRRSDSISSEITLFGIHTGFSKPHSPLSMHSTELHRAKPLLHRIGSALFATAERSIIFMGMTQLLTGIVIYTGGCRENYLNGCLAHLIKGAIFWSYGLFTFSRFLGAYASLGWAWNTAPISTPGRRAPPTAEMVECFLIFFYGATNTWMERFGAKPGDPFTAKQVQHISIAVMFAFAGLLGMGIESKAIKALLSPRGAGERVVSTPSSSFNPFPALVIGVTGAAMAAHAQQYVFQVQIHMLWGFLLVAAAVLRCMTYALLWIKPQTEEASEVAGAPSRPPTEALGGFFLACGGLVFMFSTEELTLAAMRRGRDDMMMFLNVAVAITCFACCWVFAVVGFHAYLKRRAGAGAAAARH